MYNRMSTECMYAGLNGDSRDYTHLSDHIHQAGIVPGVLP